MNTNEAVRLGGLVRGHVMNVRKGFARLARVTALTYLLVGLLGIGTALVSGVRDEGAGKTQFRVDLDRDRLLRSCRPRWDANGAPLRCDLPMFEPTALRRVSFEARIYIFPSNATDDEISRALMNNVPTSDLTNAQLQSNADAAQAARQRYFARSHASDDQFFAVEPNSIPSAHLLVWGMNGREALHTARALCQRPDVDCGTYQGVQLELPFSERLAYAWRQIAEPLAWWVGIYIALWAAFRAIRYVALGFMDQPAKP